MLKQIPGLDGYEIAVAIPTAFTGATGNSRGDKDGTDSAHTLFNVNGDVIVRIFGVCTVSLTGDSGTVEVGVAGNTAGLIAQTTATNIDANDLWSDPTPTVGVDTLASVLGPYVIANGMDIIETVATTDIATGNIYYVCMWKPLTPGSTVTALPIPDGADIRYDTP